MNSSAKTAILKKIKLPEYFTKKGSLAYYLIENKGFYFLVGILLDSSIDKDRFFIQYFIQPLFIPFPTFALTLGNRIGGYWRVEDLSEIEKALSDIIFPQNWNEVVNYLEKEFKGFKHDYLRQTLAYSAFFEGNNKQAYKILKKISSQNREGLPVWKINEIQRIDTAIAYLDKQNYEELYKTLYHSQNVTIAANKLKI